MRDELIILITKTAETENENGFVVEGSEVRSEIFARVKSVRASEFYQAYSAGMELSYIFCIDPDDWKAAYAEDESGRTVKPGMVEYDGTMYRIVRVYRTDMGEIELTVQEADHGNEL